MRQLSERKSVVIRSPNPLYSSRIIMPEGRQSLINTSQIQNVTQTVNGRQSVMNVPQVVNGSTIIQQNQQLTKLISGLNQQLQQATENNKSQELQIQSYLSRINILITDKRSLQQEIESIQNQMQAKDTEIQDINIKYTSNLQDEKQLAFKEQEEKIQLKQQIKLQELKTKDDKLVQQQNINKKNNEYDQEIKKIKEDMIGIIKMNNIKNNEYEYEIKRIKGDMNETIKMNDIKTNEYEQEKKQMKEDMNEMIYMNNRQKDELKALLNQTNRDATLLEQTQSRVFSMAQELQQERTKSQLERQNHERKEEETKEQTIILVEELEKVQSELENRMSTTQDLQVYQAQHSFLLLEVNRLNQTIFNQEQQIEDLQIQSSEQFQQIQSLRQPYSTPLPF